jgi:hypothetical protein
MRKHVTAVAALQIGFGIFGVLIGLVIFFVLGTVAAFADDPDAMVILPTVGTLVGGFFVLLSLPTIIGGIGLLKYKNWARILILIVSVFDIFNFPLGTALAIYTFWALLQDETSRLFTTEQAGVVAQPGQ